jgi:hypothetical protein
MADVKTVDEIKATPAALGGNEPIKPDFASFDTVDALRASVQELVDNSTKDREKLEGSLTSRLAVRAANFAWLAKNGKIPDFEYPSTADEQWSAIRRFLTSCCGKDRLTPTLQALLPAAVRAGMLVADGHAKVLYFPWQSQAGDKPNTGDKAQHGVERIAAPYTVIRPEFVIPARGKKKEQRTPNMGDYMTCLNSKHITELWHDKIAKAPMDSDTEGFIRRKRETTPETPNAAATKPGGTPGNVVNVENPGEVFSNLTVMFDQHKAKLANPDIADEIFRLSFHEIKTLDWSKVGKDDALWMSFNNLLTEMMEINDKYNPDKFEAAE